MASPQGSERHSTHPDHAHRHGGVDCEHRGIIHEDHTDYLHDGHLHRPHAEHTDECRIPQDAEHATDCARGRACLFHDVGHSHGPQCGHEAVPHGEHSDYLVDGHLHHPHGSHCDHHGSVSFA